MLRRAIFTLALCAVATTLSQAQPQTATGDVARADDRYLQLMRQKERSELLKMLTKEFVFTNRLGITGTAQELLQLPLTPTPLPKDRQIRIHGGHTAVVTSTLVIDQGNVRQIRVWVKEGSDWKIAAAQGTPVAQQPPK